MNIHQNNHQLSNHLKHINYDTPGSIVTQRDFQLEVRNLEPLKNSDLKQM